MVVIPPTGGGGGSNAGGNVVSNFRPQSPSIGQIWTDPNTGRREVWTGDGWETVSEGSVTNIFGSGKDGSLVVSANLTLDFNGQDVLVKEYENLFIKSGFTLDATGVPANGGLLIIRVKTSVTWEGTLDLSDLGSDGGAANQLVLGAGQSDQEAGNAGIAPFNAFGELRAGQGGRTSRTGGSSASGGGGGASTIEDGTIGNASNIPSDSGATNSAGGPAGVKITDAADVLAGSAVGIAIGPSGGGGAGGVSGFADTSSTITSGAGGKGGGSLYITCGGNFIFASGATLDLTGADAGNGSTTQGGGKTEAAAGGGGGGGGGVGVAIVRGDITDDGSTSLAGGNAGTRSVITAGGGVAEASDGGAGATGKWLVVRG